ncbi:hypothetical protein SH591_00915 [Sphingomonas sp. LY54]|uniref:hypothetical protein n=1 Tax=Sphingomonas sp. LY54 TaxID=3095343 RepID=UPI002D7916C3|nr:hypothetical protein [Sphingomonas sp. LY54]WRP28778.1 hypothetical protein SH591_00915 [Sphingomonas sp. LY54]
MNDLALFATLASAALFGLCIFAGAALRGWHGWLDVRRMEIEAGSGGHSSHPSPAARIELADLRERVRKLERIANGIDP